MRTAVAEARAGHGWLQWWSDLLEYEPPYTTAGSATPGGFHCCHCWLRRRAQIHTNRDSLPHSSPHSGGRTRQRHCPASNGKSKREMVPTVVTSWCQLWCHTARIDLHRFASICTEVRRRRGRGGRGKKRNKLRGCRSLGLVLQRLAAICQKYQRRDLNPHALNGHWILNPNPKAP